MAVLRQIWTMSAVYITMSTTELTSSLTLPEINGTTGFNMISDTFTFSPFGVLFTTLGYLTSSLLMDRIGRRSTYILGIAPGLLSSLLLTSENVQLDYFGEALNCLSFGATTILGLFIIGEYTSPKYRAIFLNFATTSIYLGQLGRHLLISHFQPPTIVNLSVILRVLALAITLTWPESPYWLIMRDHNEDCEASIDCLRGISEEATQEKNYLLYRKNDVTSEGTFAEIIKKLWKTCTRYDFQRQVYIVIFGAILMELSGRHYIPLLSSDFIATIKQGILSNLYISIVVLVMSVIGCVLVCIIRNRKYLLMSGLSSFAAMFFGSMYIFLYDNKLVSADSSWIGILFLVLHVALSNIGPTSIPFALIGEVFFLDHKAVGCFVSGVVTSVVSWAVLKLSVYLLESLHVYATLLILGTLMIILLVYLYVDLPETNGKSLAEIEKYYIQSSDYRNDGEEAQLTFA